MQTFTPLNLRKQEEFCIFVALKNKNNNYERSIYCLCCSYSDWEFFG